MIKNKRQLHVLVSVWMAGSAGRKHLQGILQFANEKTSWTLQIINSISEFTPSMLDFHIDGFIGEATSEIITLLDTNRIPAVVFADPTATTPHPTLTFMTDDNEQIGQMAANYFLSLGNFATFAFVPDKNSSPWSSGRQRGFKKHLTAQGRGIYDMPMSTSNLEEWVQKLPKPAAVLAACDFRAKEIIDACSRTNINVPKQIAVLGIDNDELICNNAQPLLSSVRINHENFGYQAAKILANHLAGKSHYKNKPLVRLPAENVVERESTNPIPPIAGLANRIQSFIREHAQEPIRIEDIVRHMRVSRRLADLRLKEATGKTIHETLQSVRLECVVRYLRKSKMPINKISRLSGFQNVQRLKYIFKAQYGVSMREFRAQAADSKD